jgi:cytochrome c
MGAFRVAMGLGLGAAVVASGTLLGCKSDQPAAMKTEPAFTTASAQVDHGGKVFGNNCAKCHGASGEGAKGPPLVGKDALPLRRPDAKVRTGEFRTAMDIAAFVTKNMPPSEEARAKLAERDYWAVLAFALNANGVKLSEPVGPHNASSIKIH